MKIEVLLARNVSRDIGQPTHYTHPELLGEDEVMPGIHKNEFKERRKKLMELIGASHTGMTEDRHVVIIPGAGTKFMSADVPYRFHQNTDMLYLSGFNEPDSVLVLEGHTLPDHKAVLYVRPRDPYRELWDGPRAGVEEAVQFTGVDESFSLESLSNHLEEKYSASGYCVWYSSEDPPHPQHADVIIEALTKSTNSKIKSVHSPSGSIAQLRLVKSLSEQALMRRAGAVASHAFRAAMQASSAGVGEAYLESVFEHSIKTNGAQWFSFPPVVAGGNRANCLHYITNNRFVDGGDLVLMDAGCEYHGYVSDVTRTWPVNGRFSAAQSALYEVVRTTKEEVTQLCRAGVTLNYLHSAASDILAAQLQTLGVISHRLNSSRLSQAMGRLFPHHVGHYLGMDTHDTMLVDRNSILTPGMVVTIEPGVYISRDFSCSAPSTMELQGTGIRLEDNVLVTEGSAEVLNRGTPDTLDELAELIPSDSVR